ncbi:protein tilB [Contarinia nasturtii]|uniref:protein tilB n=1 Tax=Contarinia nasturtii TaxID=265458 RepID=UPI0012D4335F|nr:protein tilB [Contarinia nasturtii]
MVKITEQLIRKKSEHNELIISTLEELSLHQEDIEKIEHIQNWCRDLKILLLQSNLISKIENLHKLKKLEYLNLSLNNIEIIENLEQLESLKKLDFTLNFIGYLQSVENLRDNYNLRELILTGNYCANYVGYRNFVIATLPQLHSLDGIEIKRSDRIIANREYKQCRRNIIQQQIEQQMKRDEQKIRIAREQQETANENAELTDDEINDKFWKKNSEHCPETRVDIANQHRKNQNNDVEVKKEKPKRRLFAECGRPYSLNEPKLEFRIEDFDDRIELDLHVYKYLDTSAIDVDVEPNYIRVTVKGKIFQMALNEEIRTSDATSKRSQATGHLLITMPKLSFDSTNLKMAENDAKTKIEAHKKADGRKSTVVDYRNIVSIQDEKIDESEVPPLI